MLWVVRCFVTYPEAWEADISRRMGAGSKYGMFPTYPTQEPEFEGHGACARQAKAKLLRAVQSQFLECDVALWTRECQLYGLRLRAI